MSSFQNLKRTNGNLDKLAKAIETMSSGSSEGSKNDNRFWKPEVDKVGNGYAVIRFLPTPPQDGDDFLPWAKVFHHGFQGSGGWLIENCLTTKNEKCPVCEHNMTLWNSGIESNKDIVRKQKRKLSYISNVYIVSDPKHPENEGKVFLFKFGAKIFDKITAAMNPEFEDEQAINPFDFWTGANFKLKIRKVEGYQNYDKSEFDSQEPLSDDDEELERIWKSEHSLKGFLDDDNFKTYDEIKVRLNRALGLSGTQSTSRAEDTDVDFQQPSPKARMKEESSEPKFMERKMPEIPSSDDEDDFTYFSKLAEED